MSEVILLYYINTWENTIKYFIHSFTGLIFYKNKFSKQYSEFLVAIKFRIKEHQLLHTLHIRTIVFLKTSIKVVAKIKRSASPSLKFISKY